MYDIEDEYGALHRTLRHAPLPGVNSSHVEWWFSVGRPGRLLYGGWMWDAYKLWHAGKRCLGRRGHCHGQGSPLP